MNTINTVKKQISELELEVAKLENVIAQVKGEISTTKQEINGFEFTCLNNEFDEYLDEVHESVVLFDMEFSPSDILKQCDPTAYRCAKSDYEGTKDFEDVPAYVELTEKLEDLETELGDHESDLESLQNELEDLQSELDELNTETYNTSKILYVIIDGEEILVNKNVSCVDKK